MFQQYQQLCRQPGCGTSVNLHLRQHPALPQRLQQLEATAQLMQRRCPRHTEQSHARTRNPKWMQHASSSFEAWWCRSCCMPARPRGLRTASVSMVRIGAYLGLCHLQSSTTSLPSYGQVADTIKAFAVGIAHSRG